MTYIRSTLTALAVAATLIAAGCSSGQDGAAAVPAQEASAAAGGALTADQVNVQMSLQGTPMLSSTGDSVAVTINLMNKGTTTLSSTQPHPINLGAHSADASGKIINRDLARAAIPVIAPNSQATVTIQLPVDQVIGKSAQILPVQEGVNWFNIWGTKPLIVGPFTSCSSPAVGKVCDANGKPLATAAG